MASKKEKIKKAIISNYYKKPMSVKLIDVVGSVEALNKLAEVKLPASTAFNLGKFLKEIAPDVETYGKVKITKAKEYGKQVIKDGVETEEYTFMGEDGKITEDGQKFVDEMTEIENKEVEFKIPEIKIADLSDAVLEPKYMMALQWLITE